MITTIYSDPDFLEHHGVKGMKWGVRKQIQTNMHIRGSRIASKYVQKRDIRVLKKKRKESGMSSSEYRANKKSITMEAKARRGKELVSNNKGYMKTGVRYIAKNTATVLGTAAVAGMSAGVGLPVVGLMATTAGTGLVVRNTKDTVSRIQDIHAYKKGR